MYQTPVNEFHVLLKALGYLRTHWWLFILEVIVIYGISLHKFHKTPPVYESDATLLIDTTRRQLYQTVLMSANTMNNARKQNMVHLLTGQEVLERFRNQLTEIYNEGQPAYLKSMFPGGVAYPAQVLRSFFSLSWDKNSDIYSIHCTSHNPDAAQAICLAYLNTIQNYYPEVGQRESLLKRDFLTRQISSFVNQIKEKEQGIVDYQRNNPDFINFLNLTVDNQGIQKLRTEKNNIMHKMATNRAIYKLVLSIPRAKKGEHTARATTIQVLTQKVTELQYQISLTEQSNHPDKEGRLKILRQELDDVTSRLSYLNEEEVQTFMKTPLPSAEVRQKVASLEVEYKADQIKLANVEKDLEIFSQKEKLFNQQRLQYERMFMELNHKKKLLTNLYQKQQETELELSARGSEIFRLQEPTRTGHRVAPQLSRHLYGSLSLSIFVIAITIIILIAGFPRLDSEAEVLRLNLPVIGKVPLIRKQGSTEDLPGYSLEYLKIMNYRIMREMRDAKCPIIVVSSPHAREGKSTVTHYLSLASQNPVRKTLLIDGDLLTSHPNKFFGIIEDHTPGLKSILEHPENTDYQSLIVKTSFEGIYFLPRGGRFDPSVMPNFTKPMDQVLAALRKEFDTIYIDTPPLFSSNLAHQWAGLGDLIVLVARIFHTRPKDIVEAIQTCKVFSKSPVGLALNCIRLSGPNKRASNYYFSKKKPAPPPRLAA